MPGAAHTRWRTGNWASCWWRWKTRKSPGSNSSTKTPKPAACTTCSASAKPSCTGIIDSHTYLQSLLAAAEHRGAQLILHTRVEQLEADGAGWIASGQSNGEPFQLRAQRVINAGGLFAQQLARQTQGLQNVPLLHLCQGRYFSYSGRSPFRHLIYPMPEANSAGLGIHATLDLGGQLRFGPDTQYL